MKGTSEVQSSGCLTERTNVATKNGLPQSIIRPARAANLAVLRRELLVGCALNLVGGRIAVHSESAVGGEGRKVACGG